MVEGIVVLTIMSKDKTGIEHSLALGKNDLSFFCLYCINSLY